MQNDKLKILIVEDSLLNIHSYRSVVRNLGHIIAGELLKGEEVLPFLNKNHVDLILMDIKLEGNMTGIEAAKQAKKYFNTPIIFLTGLKDEGTFKEALEAEPEIFMNKPFFEADLEKHIQTVLYKTVISKKKDKNDQDLEDNFLTDDFIMLGRPGHMQKRLLRLILWVKSEREYLKIKIKDEYWYMIKYPATHFYDHLQNVDPSRFMRVHRSYIVNLEFIESHAHDLTSLTMEDGEVIPISRANKNEFKNVFPSFR